MEEEKKREIATFRFGVISDLVMSHAHLGAWGAGEAFARESFAAVVDSLFAAHADFRLDLGALGPPLDAVDGSGVPLSPGPGRHWPESGVG